MKKLKKLLGIILCLCMLAGVTSVTASAASPVNIFNITVTAPKTGQKPSTYGSVPATASTTVTKVEWVGKFAADGTFAGGQAYTVKVTCTLKPGQDKYLKFIDGKAKINENLASFVSLANDKQSIVLQYTFAKTENTGNSTSNNSSKDILTTDFKDLSLHDYEWEVLRLTNIERANQGLSALSMPQALQKACDVREKEVVTVFSHTRPDGSDFFTAIDSTFKCIGNGENIAKGHKNPEAVMMAWMNSSGHRANILRAEFGYLGVGYYSNDKGWVQIFGTRNPITKVEPSTKKTAFTEQGILDHYLRLTTSDGYVSYLPLDFNSMKQNKDGSYSPRISASNLPSYIMLEEDSSENNGQKVYYPKFLSETLDGFLSTDGKVYSISDTPSIVVGNLIEPVSNYRANFGQMHRTTLTFRAYNSSTDESLPLLPSIGSWYYDEKQTVLLERKDGSMWVSAIFPKITAADLSAKVGGYENSNVIKITGTQKKKVNAEYITFSNKKK